MKVRDTLGMFFLLLLLILMSGCGPFSAMRPAEVDKGLSLKIESGLTSPPSRKTYWFYDLDGCPLCYSKSIRIAQVGIRYGFKPLSVGIHGNLDGLQAEIYGQLYEGQKINYGIGGRLGLPTLNTWYSHQLFFLLDLKLKKSLKLPLNPGFYYHTGQSPNGANKGSLLFLTQSIGLAIESKYITFFPIISLVGGKGYLTLGNSGKSMKFNDIFSSLTFGLTFHKAKE